MSAAVKRRAKKTIAQRRLCPYCRYPRGTSRLCTECGREFPRRRHRRVAPKGKRPGLLDWIPADSQRAREIFAHTTRREKARLRWGTAVYAPCALAIAVALLVWLPRPTGGWIIAFCVLGALYLLLLALFIRRQKRVLCSTAWARRHGITPKDLRRNPPARAE